MAAPTARNQIRPRITGGTLELRRVFARIYTLVSKVAADVHTTLRHGDKLIAELSAHLQRRAVAEPAARRPELATRRADDE